MDTTNWVYIVITMCPHTNEPRVNLATQNEKLAHEYHASILGEKPMFYIQELTNDQT